MSENLSSFNQTPPRSSLQETLEMVLFVHYRSKETCAELLASLTLCCSIIWGQQLQLPLQGHGLHAQGYHMEVVEKLSAIRGLCITACQ